MASSVGKYMLEERLGVGGMAEVFKASTQGAAGVTRRVAIKRILPGYSNNPTFSRMFIDEAHLSSRLLHPNIVSVLDFDHDADGRLFLVMELVEGCDLTSLLATGVLPYEVIVHVVVELLRGLDFAHEFQLGDNARGLIHRDVSPHNVLLSWNGEVKVSDFGIAKARDATDATQSALLKGKPAYMSPEQANGQSLDARSDLFAVGIILWEMLVGKRLFVAEDTRATLAAVLFGKVPRPRQLASDVPKDLERVAMKLLDRDLEARYHSATAAVQDLLRCKSATERGGHMLSATLAERFIRNAPLRESKPSHSSTGAASTPLVRHGRAFLGSRRRTAALLILFALFCGGSYLYFGHSERLATSKSAPELRLSKSAVRHVRSGVDLTDAPMCDAFFKEMDHMASCTRAPIWLRDVAKLEEDAVWAGVATIYRSLGSAKSEESACKAVLDGLVDKSRSYCPTTIEGARAAPVVADAATGDAGIDFSSAPSCVAYLREVERARTCEEAPVAIRDAWEVVAARLQTNIFEVTRKFGSPIILETSCQTALSAFVAKNGHYCGAQATEGSREGGAAISSDGGIMDALPQLVDGSVVVLSPVCSEYVKGMERVSKCPIYSQETRDSIAHSAVLMRDGYMRAMDARTAKIIDAGCKTGLDQLLRSHPGC